MRITSSGPWSAVSPCPFASSHASLAIDLAVAVTADAVAAFPHNPLYTPTYVAEWPERGHMWL